MEWYTYVIMTITDFKYSKSLPMCVCVCGNDINFLVSHFLVGVECGKYHYHTRALLGPSWSELQI